MAPRWNFTLNPDGRDSRVYDDAHLEWRSGYDHKPVWDDSLDFCFPTGSLKTARVIVFEGDEDYPEEKLLLWSPNSLKRFPFFPGLRVTGAIKAPPHPFCDGHLGPFDPTRSPQYFDVRFPFFPFMRRCDRGFFPDEEEECVPVWATWQSVPERGSVLGTVSQAYWRALQQRVHQLCMESIGLSKEPLCHVWTGFVESLPRFPHVSELEQMPPRSRFQEFIRIMTALLHDIQWLVAWVRMGKALTQRPFEHDLSIVKASFGATQEDLMGVWANGIPESKAAWFAGCGIPLFVAHEIQGHKDRPDNYGTLQKVNHPLEGSDLAESHVLDTWMGLGKGKLVTRYWDTGVNIKAKVTKDMLLRWRSAPTASLHNFPGDLWSADSPALSASPTTANAFSRDFFELLDTVMEWKSLSMGSAHGASYLIPPSVRDTSKGHWQHFAEDITIDGISAFYLVGRRNQSVCSGLNHLFYDRSLKRILHCDGPLPIPTVVVHDTSIYGFPCPKVHFYQDNSLNRKLQSSFWLYTTMDPSFGDVGKSAPSPSLERVSKLLPHDKRDNTPQSANQQWTTDTPWSSFPFLH